MSELECLATPKVDDLIRTLKEYRRHDDQIPLKALTVKALRQVQKSGYLGKSDKKSLCLVLNELTDEAFKRHFLISKDAITATFKRPKT